MLVAAGGDLFGVSGVASDARGGRAGVAARANTGWSEGFAFLLGFEDVVLLVVWLID